MGQCCDCGAAKAGNSSNEAQLDSVVTSVTSEVELKLDESKQKELTASPQLSPGSSPPPISPKKLERKRTFSGRMYDKISSSAEKTFSRVMGEVDLLKPLMKGVGFVIKDIKLQIGDPTKISMKIGVKKSSLKNLNKINKQLEAIDRSSLSAAGKALLKSIEKAIKANMKQKDKNFGLKSFSIALSVGIASMGVPIPKVIMQFGPLGGKGPKKGGKKKDEDEDSDEDEDDDDDDDDD